jgi:hypothetical protein
MGSGEKAMPERKNKPTANSKTQTNVQRKVAKAQSKSRKFQKQHIPGFVFL